jgi:hypothetical protein
MSMSMSMQRATGSQGCADAHDDTPRRNVYRGIRGKARSPPRISDAFGWPTTRAQAALRCLVDGACDRGCASVARRRAARRRRTIAKAADGRELARWPATPITPEACPQTDRKPWRIAIPGRSPLPLRRGRNQDSDGGGRGEKNPLGRGSSRCTCRRAAAGLVENAGVARLRRRASNENTVPLETVPRSKQCPNTEPRQDDGALHDSRRHGAALSHSATLSHGAAFPRTQPSHTAPLAALRSRLPPSRPYGCERPCRWC